MTKGRGIELYVDFTTATTYTEISCITALEGFGVTASPVEIEPCLGDTTVLEEPGDAKNNPITSEYKITPSGSNISETLRTAIRDKTLGSVVIGYPTTTPIYAAMSAYISEHVDLPAERNQDLKARIVFIQQSAATWSTTAPATA